MALAVLLLIFCSLWIGSLAVPVFNCSAIAENDKVPCLLSSPNITTCTGIGCCWDFSPRISGLKCYTKKGGRCLMYQRGVCFKALNSTLLPYRDTPRFIDNKLGVLVTEKFLALVQSVIMEYVSDARCQNILSNMLCQYTLPPCAADGTIKAFCREDCEAIFKRCQGPLNQVIGAVKFIAKEKKIDFIHTGFPNCSRYKLSTEYDVTKNETCVQTGFFTFEKPKSEGDKGKLNVLVIVLPVVIVVLLIIFIIVIFIVRQKSQEREKAMRNSMFLVNKDAITMRDKLRADSMKSLDTRLLRLYDPQKLKHYPLDRVEYIKDLGEGHFGKVFQGRVADFVDGQPKKVIYVAVKALKEGSSKELKDEFYQEVALMSILDHPNVVKLLAVSTEEEPYGMIFEFMSEGDLNHYLRVAKPAESSRNSGTDEAKVFLSKEDLLCISEQIAAGMEHLAALKFVHRDLAARNCLVGTDMLVKIADFGMSRDVYGSNYYKMSRETLLPIRWLAPEAFLYGKFTIMSDVYSYGVVLWEIYTFGLQPYYGYTNREVTEFIKKGIHLGKPDDCPHHMYALMKDCWTKDPDGRPDFDLIQERLRNPYRDYDVPTSESKPEVEEDKTDGSQDIPDFGNYDVPKSSPSSTYDIPKGFQEENEHGNYDVPKSPEREDNYKIPTSRKDETHLRHEEDAIVI